MFRPTIKSISHNHQILTRRSASGQYVLDGPLPRRPLKKIKLGKARPAIYYKFNCKTEYSDGSVVVRRSVFPKDELRLIQDQRNSPLWNPNRSDLEVVDANAGGRLEKFQQKFTAFTVQEEKPEESKKEESTKEEKITEKVEKTDEDKLETKEEESEAFLLDDYLDLLGQNVQEVQKGGKLATKQKGKKK